MCTSKEALPAIEVVGPVGRPAFLVIRDMILME